MVDGERLNIVKAISHIFYANAKNYEMDFGTNFWISICCARNV